MSFVDTLKHRIIEIKKATVADPELVEKRLAICATCPELFAPTNTCKKCGCFMTAKTHLAAASCPLTKW